MKKWRNVGMKMMECRDEEMGNVEMKDDRDEGMEKCKGTKKYRKDRNEKIYS